MEISNGPKEAYKGFHLNDNWFFMRQKDGSVLIRHFVDNDSAETDVKLEIPAVGWCSIVASVSSEGETRLTWDLVVALHGKWTVK